jgi:glycosyltransferase involved in cell wall biosynthesis
VAGVRECPEPLISVPLISVITIFLNAERFIEEAIESVLAQSYERWELLLVDDGSTDASTRIARRYADAHPDRVQYFEHAAHANRGKSTSRNLGIRHARGRYLAFLDADDIFLPSKLERQVAWLQAQPRAAMVYGPSLYWYSWATDRGNTRPDRLGRLGVEPGTLFEPPTLLIRFLEDGGTVPCICGLLVRREVVEGRGGFDETIQDMYEDQVLLAKICLESPILVEDLCLDKYRQHPQSSSQAAIKAGQYHPLEPNPARRGFLVWLSAYVTERGVRDSALARALATELWLYQHPWLYRYLALARRGTRLLVRMTRSLAHARWCRAGSRS